MTSDLSQLGLLGMKPECKRSRTRVCDRNKLKQQTPDCPARTLTSVCVTAKRVSRHAGGPWSLWAVSRSTCGGMRRWKLQGVLQQLFVSQSDDETWLLTKVYSFMTSSGCRILTQVPTKHTFLSLSPNITNKTIIC